MKTSVLILLLSATLPASAQYGFTRLRSAGVDYLPKGMSSDTLSWTGQTLTQGLTRNSPGRGTETFVPPSGTAAQQVRGLDGNAAYGSYTVSDPVQSAAQRYFRHTYEGGYATTVLPGYQPILVGASPDGRILGVRRTNPDFSFSTSRMVDGVMGADVSDFNVYGMAGNGAFIGGRGTNAATLALDGTAFLIPRPAGVGAGVATVASEANPDGTAILGSVFLATPTSFLWTTTGGSILLPSPSAGTGTRANLVSADGATVFGTYGSTTSSIFMWTRTGGSVDFRTYLGSLGVTNLPNNISLDAVTQFGRAGDGTMAFMGYGTLNGQQQVGWRIAVPQAVPEPASLAAITVGLLALARRRRS